MTENYSPPATGVPAWETTPVAPVAPVTAVYDTDPSADTREQSTKDVAKDQAATVGQGAADAGQHVAAVAKDQAGQVTAEAGAQVKQLAGQAQSGLKEQAGVQQEKLVTGLRSLSEELTSMASNAEQPGVASDLARQAAQRTGAVAGWLDGREPASVLNEVSSFARRRPGAFLAIAAGVGLVAGRLTRGLVADAHSADAGAPAGGSAQSGLATPTVAPVASTPPGEVDIDAALIPPTVPPAYLGASS